MFKIKEKFYKQIDGTGLAVFRIVYCSVLICEILQMLYFKNLIFDNVPYIELSEIDFKIPILVWLVSVVFILFGFFTRFFTILNYLMTLILVGTISTFEYHVFYAYLGINFLMIILPISRCLSIDRVLLKLKYSNTRSRHTPSKKVSQLYYFLPVFIGLGLVYFDSIFYKLVSPMWMDGLGSWKPSSLPMVTQVKFMWILNNEWLSKSIGWMTILFEFMFMFIFFRKKIRLLVFLIGIMLHLGIVLVFPIPWFGLTACAIYILMIPVSFWGKLFYKRKKTSKLNFYYDKDCPLCVRTIIIISSLDWFSRVSFKTVQYDASYEKLLKAIDKQKLLDDIHVVKGEKVYAGVDSYVQVLRSVVILRPLSFVLRFPGIYHLALRAYAYVALNRNTDRCTEEDCGYIVPAVFDSRKFKIFKNFTLEDFKFKGISFIFIFVVCIQASLIFNSQLSLMCKEKIGFRNSQVDLFIDDFFRPIKNVCHVLFGLTAHPVFNDSHFDSYNHIVGITYLDEKGSEIWLPIINRDGEPGFYNYGANWVKWTFRVNGPSISQRKLIDGIKRFTAFWIEKNNKDLRKYHRLNIKVKKIESPSGWEKDFLIKQINNKWIDGGYVEWNEKHFSSHIFDIENL